MRSPTRTLLIGASVMLALLALPQIAGFAQTNSLSLDAIPVPDRLAASDSGIVGRVSAAPGLIAFSDEKGRLSAVTRKGEIAWSIATANAPGGYSFPVVVGERVYYSGPAESLIVELGTGRVVFRARLEGGSAHLYGQRMAAVGGYGAYPAGDEILLFDLATGAESASIKIPNGSLMTPGSWNGKLITVSQSGALLIIDPARAAVEEQIQTSALQPVGCSVCVLKDRAYFADYRGLVVCVDLRAAKVLWESLLSTQERAGVFQDLACDEDRVIAYSKGTLYGLASDTGEPAFSPIAGVSSPALLRAGFLYYGTNRGVLRIARADTGATLNSLDVGGSISTRPEWIDGTLVVGTAKGEILLINTGSAR